MIQSRRAAEVLALTVAVGVPPGARARQEPAQTAQTPPPRAAPAQARPPGIRAAEILVRAEAVGARLRAVRPGSASDPAVLFSGFGERSVDFESRFWAANVDRCVAIQSDTTDALHDALDEAGTTIPSPRRDVHVTSLDRPVAVPPTAQDRSPA